MAIAKGAVTYEQATARFLEEKCPLCGRGKGEKKGLEQRPPNMGDDRYCHSCRRAWTTEAVLALKEELKVLSVL